MAQKSCRPLKLFGWSWSSSRGIVEINNFFSVIGFGNFFIRNEDSDNFLTRLKVDAFYFLILTVDNFSFGVGFDLILNVFVFTWN